MAFDFETNDLQVISMHCYETYKLKVTGLCERNRLNDAQGGQDRIATTPLVRVDSLNRCAAVVIYDRNLAVLPFRQVSPLLELEQSAEDRLVRLREMINKVFSASWEKPVLPSFVVDLSSMGIRHVKDMTFLQGYYEPTLLVLHEPNQTWAGYVRSSLPILTLSQPRSLKQELLCCKCAVA
jgi:cleavage and polyadenylation specificity factor subunit 1